MANSKDFIVKNGLVVLAQGSIQSTSTDTGAIVTPGGMGIGGNINIGGTANIIGNLIVNGYNLQAYDQDVFYVSEQIGDDNNDGRKLESSFKTISKALSVASTGTVVKIEPGTYTETWPLTVPTGVTVKGAGLRATLVQPTTATNTQTCFLLNGEVQVTDLTITNFYQPGYGFKFANGAKITTKSPYVERVSVITRGTVTSTEDPFGFSANDAGNGAYLDAGVLDPTSLEPAMLWNEVTFIVPNAIGWYMTNGARAEILNGFTYFAEKSIQAVAGPTGYGGVGRTRIRLGGVSGTFAPGDTLDYYNNTGTLVASHVIDEVVGDYIYFNGPAYGYRTAQEAGTSTQYVFSVGTSSATATSILLADYHQFGAELRCIGSAAVFGTNGVIADGTGTDLQLIAFNMSYVGAGGDLTTDGSLVVQGNEVIQTNGGKVFFQTVDQAGNFRVGGSFLVNQRTGDVSFGNANISLNTLSNIIVSDGINAATIEPTTITVGNLIFSAGTIQSSSGNLTLQAAGANIVLNEDTRVIGNFTATGIIESLSTANATSPVTGAIQSLGGIASAKDIWVGGNLTVENTASIISTANATSTATGALVVSGGAGIGKNLYVGGDTYLIGNLFVDGGQYIVTSTNLFIADKTITVASTASTTGLAQEGGFIVGPGNGYVSLLFDGSTSWKSKGSIVPNGTANLGGLTNAWNNVYANSVFDNQNRVVTSVTPSAGQGIAITNLASSGPAATFQVTNTGVLSIIAGTDTQVTNATGNVTINVTATLGTVAARGATSNNAIYINSSTAATNTSTGALRVEGGVGIGGRLYVKETIFSNNAQVWTTATLTDNSQIGNGAGYLTSSTIGLYGVSAINAGTGIAVNVNTGSVTVTNVGVVSLQGSAYIAVSTSTGSVQVVNLGVQTLTAGTDTAVSRTTGTVVVWGISTLQSVTSRGATTNQALAITATNLSATTSSGQALLVSGGIGALAVYASNVFDSGNRVLTSVTPVAGTAISVTGVSTASGNTAFTINNTGVTATIGTTYLGVSGATGAVTFTNLGVQTVTAGSGTTVSASTGQVTISSIDTLQLVTNRGSTTTNAIVINNASQSTSTNTGALQILGGVGINQSLFVGGDVTIVGTINANTVVGSISTATNLLGGATGSIPYQTTSGQTRFIGIGSNGTLLQSNGSTATWNSTLTIHVGSAQGAVTATNIVGGIVNGTNGQLSGVFTITNATPASSTTTGALQVVGGAGIGGALYAGSVFDSGVRVIQQVNVGPGLSISNASGPSVTLTNTGVLSLTGEPALGVSSSNGNITLTNLGVTSITTGSGIVVDNSTGTVNIASIDTLQLVTTRGSTTDKAISISNTLTVSSLVVQNGMFGGINFIEASQAVGTNSTSNYWIQVLTFTLPNVGDSIQFKAKSIVRYWNSTSLSDNADNDILWVSLVKDTGTTLNGTAYWFNESSESAVSGSTANHSITYNGTTGQVQVWRRATAAGARAYVTIFEQFASNPTVGIQSVSPTVVSTSAWVSAVPTLGTSLTIDDPDTLSQEDITVSGTLTAQGTLSHSGTTGNLNNTTLANTLNLSAGGIGSGVTKTVNIATGGLTGSTGNVNIGSNVAQGVLTIATTETDITSTVNATNTLTGALTVAGGVGIGRDLYVGGLERLINTTNASSTSTGALTVAGGVGIGGNLYAGGLVYSEGSQVITAATLGAFGVSQINAGPYIGVTPTSGTGSVTISNLGVQAITTGSGIAVTTSTGTVNIASIDTLQLVTDRGAATSNAIQITNLQPAISTSTGSIVVSGGIGVGQGLYVGGQSTFLGTITGVISSATNLALGSAGALPYQASTGSTSFLGIGTNGFILQSTGSLPAWVSTSTLSVGFSDRSNTATNLAAGSAGQVPYQSAAGATAFVGGPALAGNILVSNGSNAPSFNNTLTLAGTIDATNTLSGTLQVRGGVGIGGTVWIGGDLWSRGSQVVTANNLGLFGVAQIVAGNAISVSPAGGTGTVTIGNLGVTSITTTTVGGLVVSTSTGSVSIVSIDTLQLVTQRGPSTNQPISITATNLSSTTSTGQALLVSGGIGALAVFARVLNDSGNRVITTVTPAAGPGIGISSLNNSGPAASFNITNLGVQTLTAGTDTAVSASTGTVTVWGISTLQSVTNRGNSTTNIVYFNNTASATTNTNGSVVIAGGLGVAGDVYARNFYTNGQIIGASASSSTNLAGGLTGSIPYQTAPGLTGFIDIGANGTILTSNGTTATWQSPTALTAGQATTATHISGGLAGWIPIQTAAGRSSWINSGTQNQLLMMGINTASWVTTTTIHVGQSVFATTSTNIANGVGGQLIYQIGVGQTSFVALGGVGSVLVSGGTGTPIWQNTLTLAGSTQATSTLTGALTVAGGVGIGGNLWVGGVLYATVEGSINTATNIAGGTTGSIPIQSAVGQTRFINIGSNGTILQSNGTTATFVSTSNLVVGFADSTRGATNVSGGSAGALVYQTAPSASGFVGIGGIGSLLQVSSAGTPTWVTTATVTVGGAITAATATHIAGGALGSIHYQTAAGRTGFIGIGPAGAILQSDGSTASWYTTATLLSGSAQNLNAGVQGQIPYQESPGVTRFIGTGSQGSLLVMGAANTATFVAAGLVTVGNATNATTSTRTQTVWGGTAGQLHYQSAANTTDFVNTGTEGMLLISRPTGPAFVNTLTLAGTTQATSTVTGALQVRGGVGIGGDVWIGGVLYATVSGSINTATNLNAGAAGSLVYQSAVGTTAFLSIGASGTILRSNGSVPQWATTASLLVGDALRAQSVNNITGGAAGSIPIQSAANTTAFIPIGGAGTLLQSNGSTATWVSTGSLVAGTAARAVNIAGGAANQIPYQSAADSTTFSSNLTFNGSALTVGGAVTGAQFIPTSASVPTNGMYLAAANQLGLAAGSANQVNITTTGVGIKKTAAVALDVSGQIQGDNIINTTNTANATASGTGAMRSAGGISAASDIWAAGMITGQNGVRRTLSRVSTTAYQPLGAHSLGETVFEIDPTWTQAELQSFFNTTSVTWVADSTAPGYAIQIDGAPSVGNNSYGSGFPYIPVESDDIFYMECWIRNDPSYVGAGHYMGSIDFDHNYSNLGGNPGSFGYWVMSNTNPGTSWTRVTGYITGFGSSTGQFRPGTKYWSPQALFNYSYTSGTRRSFISGWKVIRVNQNGNRTLTGTVNITNTTGATSVGTGALRVSGGASVSGQLWMGNSILGRVDSANTNGDANAPFRFSQDYSAWASHWAGTPGSNDGWGLFWAGNSGARYGTNGTGGPGNIWGNSSNPNEAVFVGGGTTRWTLRLDDGQSWQQSNAFFGGDVYTSYSDVRLKDIKGSIENPLDKLRQIETFYYEPNELAVSMGAQAGRKVGVSAQSVLKVLPEVVAPSPLNKEYLTVQYEKMVPLLIESIKELERIVKDQQEQINKLKGL